MIQPPPIQSQRHYWEVLRFVWGILSVGWPEGAWISSWYRTPEHNRRVGGHPESQHLAGLAIDVVLPGSDPGFNPQLAFDLERVGLVPVREPTHLHVQAFAAGVAARLGLIPYEDDVPA